MEFSMNAVYLVLSVMIITSEDVMATVTMTQGNSEVIVGGTTSILCVTTLPKEIFFRHFPAGRPDHEQKAVYAYGQMHSSYRGRGEMRINKTTGLYQLIIRRVELTDAGIFMCQEDEGIGDSSQANLIVLETGPTCSSAKNPIELIGPNSCNKEQEDLTLACSVEYRGNSPPLLEWIMVGANDTVTQGVTVERLDNRITSHLTMPSQPALDGSSFICQTAETKYNCTSDVINIIYVIGSNFTQKASVGDTVLCTAYTNESCSYRWKWFKGDDILTASNSRTLIPKQSGNFRCEADCIIRNESCTITAGFAYVEDVNAASSTAGAQDHHQLLWLVILIPLCIVLVVLLYCIWKRSHQVPAKEHVLLMDAAPVKESVLLMDAAPLGMEDSQVKSNSGMEDSQVKSLPIIKDQHMLNTLIDNQYFIDRGTSGAIYGPFRWNVRKCALKQILYSPDKLTEEKKKEITQLIEHGRELDHPHLLKAFEVWFLPPALYMVMEYAEGRSLDKILRPKDAPSPLLPFPLETVQDWALQIADGMSYLHRRKLVHRNLKAAHVLVMEMSDVSPKTLKIGSYTLTKDHDHSTVMSLKGTMAWMAPEYIRGEKFSMRSDVWSYGVTVWEILTRDVPYKQIRKETDLVRAAIDKTLKLEISDSCPELLQKLLTKCWKYEVSDRHSFEQICDILRSSGDLCIPKSVCNNGFVACST